MKRNFISLIFLCLIGCEFQHPEKAFPLHFSDVIMGTSYTVKVSSIPSSLNKDELTNQIKSLLVDLDKKMSTYRVDSELSLFNSSQSTQWYEVSQALFFVLNEAKRVNQLSQGAFDITVGPIVNLWGFGPDFMANKLPSDEVIKAELKKMGSDYLLLDEGAFRIKKKNPGLYLDLSAIAKGYAVDQVGELLEQHEIKDYMVEIGGELRLKGKNLSNKSWRIAIEKPTEKNRVIQKVLPLTDVSLATSGDYRNYFEVDKQRFSHTIDPRTGKPISHKLASVTILSDTTITADAFATALMVLGLDEGYQLAEKQKIAALFITKTEDGFVEKSSTRFKQKFQ